jgi:uncharacterized membrane protein (UPF0127 family)
MTHRSGRRRSLAAVALAAVVLAAAPLAACGGSSDSPVAVAPTTPAGLVGEWADQEVGGRTPLRGFGAVAATITAADGTVCEVCLLGAFSSEQRAAGLMYVTDPELGGHDGMVFTFDDDVATGFWMRNTRLPLSIAYFDADGVLVSVADMEPCPDGENCPVYAAAAPFRYAVEVPQGQLADIGVVGPDGATAEARDAVLEVSDQPCPAVSDDPDEG